MNHWVDGLTKWQLDGFASAEAQWETYLELSWPVLSANGTGLLLPYVVSADTITARCNAPTTTAWARGGTGFCHGVAGRGTAHEGAGRCVAHGGSKRFGRAEGAWIMAHAYAVAKQTTPWDALLAEVCDLAGQVAWLNQKIGIEAQVGGDDSLRPGGLAHDWIVMRDARGDRLAKVSVMAINCGVAERVLQQIELNGELMFRAATLAAAELAAELSLTPDQELLLVSTVARKVVEVERDQNRLEIESTISGGL